ncbi:MAG: toll/interleukin-1 receptor domain-containing protein [Bacteroidota bacterium]
MKAPKISPSETNKRYQYDLFISYSHKDKKQVDWLSHFLENHWVPGFKKRKLFVDSKSLKGEGGLSYSIKDALKNSEFLLVCCSQNAKDSKWVDKEVEAFLETHPPKSVLACQLGPETEPHPIPKSIEAVEALLEDELLKPDLRDPKFLDTRDQKKARKLEALTILATILKLPDKNAILDKRKKRQTIWTIILVTVLLMGFISLFLFNQWKNSPQGLRMQTMNAVIKAAQTNRVSQPDYIATAEIIAKEKGKKQLLKFVKVYDEFLRIPALASGYAALPHPDCSAIEALLQTKVDSFYLRKWPRGLIKSATVCGKDEWLNYLPPLSPDELPRRALVLAELGMETASSALIAMDSFPPEEKLPTLFQLQLHRNVDIQFEPEDLENWLVSKEDFDQLYELAKALEALNTYNRLDTKLGKLLSERAYQICRQIGEDIEFANTWNLIQPIAASLAGLKETSKASELLALGKQHTPHVELNPYWAPGWAWRGVALNFLGQAENAQQALDRASESATIEIPASRNWEEWNDIMASYSILDEWEKAFQATDQPKNELVRFDLKCKALKIWDQRLENKLK